MYMLLLCICVFCFFLFFKQKTAYEMRISDWSSDVCSSDLLRGRNCFHAEGAAGRKGTVRTPRLSWSGCGKPVPDDTWIARQSKQDNLRTAARTDAPSRADAAARRRYSRHPGRYPRHSREENSLLQGCRVPLALDARSEEHTSELQSLMRISYAVFCLKKKHKTTKT